MNPTTIKAIPLTTARLILRAYQSGDEIALFHEYFNDAPASQYLQRRPHQSIDQTKTALENWALHKWHNADAEFMWIIADQMNGNAMGILILMQQDDFAEIHFGLGQSHQGQGLMLEAVHAVIEYVKKQTTLRGISSFCATQHSQSQKVFVRSGFQHIEHLPHHAIFPALGEAAQDCVRYAIIW